MVDLEADIEGLKAKIEALQRSKRRMIKAHMGLIKENKRKKRQAKRLAQMLEAGENLYGSYADWTAEQFGEAPK
jgi:hypothetical protein